MLLLVVLGLTTVTEGTASAHIGRAGATCEALTVTLTDYKTPGTNTVKVVVDGATLADTTFVEEYSQSFGLGNPAVAHTWSVAVTAWDDPDGSIGWTFTKSDSSTPCTPPDACPDLEGDQPPDTMCTPPPDDKETREVRGTPDCTSETVTVTTEERTRSYSWNGTSWVPGPWSSWKTVSTRSEPTQPGDCAENKVTSAAPGYTPPSCASAPSLHLPQGVGYHWVLSGPADARIATAVADTGYTLTGTTVYGPYDTTAWTAQKRVEEGCAVVLAAPQVQQEARCDARGSIAPLVGALVTYTISGGSWSGLAAGDYTITATLKGGATEFDAAAAAGWSIAGTTATRVVHIGAPKTCVVPSAQVSPQVCVPAGTTTGGAITLGTQPGISYVVTGADGAVIAPTALSSLAPGTYTVTATALSGFDVVAGNGFISGVRTLVVPPAATDCRQAAAVRPAVSVVDECYTADDKVVFEAENAYWTASASDATHVTFTAKDAYYFADDQGNQTKQVVLEHAPTTNEQCPLLPGSVETACVGDVPYLDYAMTLPEGFETDDPTPLTITFVNPDGPDHAITGLPLSGRVLWPGASATPPLMWPGWDLVDGEYVDVGDQRFGWTRDGITVRFKVNPEYSTTLNYPPATVACANPPTTSRTPELPPTGPPPGAFRPPPAIGPPPLPNTGGPSSLLAGLGALLLVAGCAMVWRARRTRPTTD
ncbi:hypothetical protein GON03_10260 [Nocardioides sp. MAH-18]|uniref:LPXTG cell wall anchor domain-containing protein n=1 Tax=Nocardioides agri TaxID=2682843 RepID=A0A6L6XS14_9ACTN|nr:MULTISPECIES: hypothetical protein [unclassified Nocardioides]MBA2954707.1 hypothetical protein [Nocardioides sp. CGMCC 1.13656]MVQ49563.1 hypothetical protein [Nocardioides sp. MAH-18]